MACAAEYASLAIDDLVRNQFVNDGTVLVRNVMSSSDRSCYALFENSMTTTNDDKFLLPDRGIVLGTGGDPFGETMALVRQEDTGEYYPDPSSELQTLSDGGIGASHKTCGFQFEFRCDGNMVKFGYVLASDEYGMASAHDNLFMVSMNRQSDDLTPDDNDWSGDIIPGWNKIEFSIVNGGDDDVDSWAFLEAGSFSCLGSADWYDLAQPDADANDDETDMVQRSPIPIAAVVVVAVLLLMVAIWMTLICVAFDDHRATRDENSTDSPTAAPAPVSAPAAASADQSPSRTNVMIVSPNVSPTTVWYYPYTWWYNPYTYYYR